jgi:hypothetical protein
MISLVVTDFQRTEPIPAAYITKLFHPQLPYKVACRVSGLGWNFVHVICEIGLSPPARYTHLKVKQMSATIFNANSLWVGTEPLIVAAARFGERRKA